MMKPGGRADHQPRNLALLWAILAFWVLVFCLWLVAKRFGVPIAPYTVVHAILIIGPYWAFGFGLDRWLREKVSGRIALTLCAFLLLVPYLLVSLTQGLFRWGLFILMTAVILVVMLLLHRRDSSLPEWQDWLVLAILGLSVELHLFDRVWPVTGLSKLVFVDLGLYGYLVVRPIGGVGFDLRARWADFGIGLREFLFFAPIAIPLGLGVGFLQFHKTAGDALTFAAGWLFTLLFVAMPEELFFRGLMLNLLERRLGSGPALMVSSLLFGLAHFNKRAASFNWRYVLLAAITGVFYGRAWLAKRRLMTSAITHATVDTVWSMWLR